MKRLLLIILSSLFPLLTQAKNCISIEQLSINLDLNTTNDGVSRFNIYYNNNKLFTYEALEVDDKTNNVEYSDLDFDGENEIILRVDNNPAHNIEYAVLKLVCNKLEIHPLFPEVKGYEILGNKKTKIYYKDSYSIKENIYCFQPVGYLCEEIQTIDNGYKIRKIYYQSGIVSASNIYYDEKKLTPIIKIKSYLYYNLNKKSNMYLVKGDKVSILDEKTDKNEERWYFINYKGKKDINMWIKADAIELN